jgi:predicted DNA-binding transcriptional regulator AlpA
MKLLNFSGMSKKLNERSRSSIYRDVERGDLPRPIKIGRSVFWIEEQIDQHLQSLSKISDQNPTLPPQSNTSTGADAHAAFAHRESHDDYDGVIVVCREGRRIIIDKTASQYIAQERSSSTNTGVWIGKSHCTTRDELLNVCSRLKLLSDATVEAVLRALPEYARDYSRK